MKDNVLKAKVKEGEFHPVKFGIYEIMIAFHPARSKEAEWATDYHSEFRHHKIMLKVSGKVVDFDFWTSQASPYISTYIDLLEAFRCYLLGALSGTESFEDFCSNYGYSELPLREYGRIKAIHKGCVDAKDNIERLFAGADVPDLYNDFKEKFDI